MALIFNYSPNFEIKKRKASKVIFIIFHYTGMQKEKNAIKKLIDSKSKVSCHYFIKKNGQVIQMVPDLYIAWHAGISKWGKYKSLNRYSIGIEISNTGHRFNNENYSKKQINSIIKLSKFLITKYNIKKKNILGHSDIAPERKQDPGEKFPWKFLAKNKIGYWHNLSQNYLSKKRKVKIKEIDKKKFFQNLYQLGYLKISSDTKNKFNKLIIKAFQRRFRQELINGIVDKECLKISYSLLNKFT
jgi:N-acetylmuramoyl-L-alanine amidase